MSNSIDTAAKQVKEDAAEAKSVIIDEAAGTIEKVNQEVQSRVE